MTEEERKKIVEEIRKSNEDADQGLGHVLEKLNQTLEKMNKTIDQFNVKDKK